MRRRRGLIFWALRLRSTRCWRCHRDLIWRERSGMPLVCRWCDRPTLFITAAGLASAAARAARVMDDFVRQLEEFNRVFAAPSDRLDALAWSLYAPGVKPPRTRDEPGGMFAGLGGELDCGIVRDSAMDQRNNLTVFAEQWENLRPDLTRVDEPPEQM